MEESLLPYSLLTARYSLLPIPCSPFRASFVPAARALKPSVIHPDRGVGERRQAHIRATLCEAWRVPCDRDARLSALHRGDFWPGAALLVSGIASGSVERAPRS